MVLLSDINTLQLHPKLPHVSAFADFRSRKFIVWLPKFGKYFEMLLFFNKLSYWLFLPTSLYGYGLFEKFFNRSLVTEETLESCWWNSVVIWTWWCQLQITLGHSVKCTPKNGKIRHVSKSQSKNSSFNRVLHKFTLDRWFGLCKFFVDF